MAQVTITINSREYAVACEDGQEVRIIQLARLLDEKAKLLNLSIGQVNESMVLVLAGLLLADELSELKKGEKTLAAAPVDNSRLLEFDASLCEEIKSLKNQIISVASSIEML